jgi:sec-independent protein translocase protein TatB
MVAIHFTGVAAAALPLARIQTASIGIPDTLFLMLLALVVFGPRRLPEIGRQIGKLMYEFRKVSNDFKFQMEEELRASEEAERMRKIQAEARAPLPPVAAEPAALELTSSTEATPSVPEAAPPVEGEVRAYSSDHSTEDSPDLTPKFPQIAPPSTGEPIAAQRPFRGRFSESGVEQEAPEAASAAGTEEEVRHG